MTSENETNDTAAENGDPGTAQPAEPAVPTPSKRLTAALAAAMLGVGVAVGAAIGPAPSSSFGVDAPLAALLRSLLAEKPSANQPSETGSGEQSGSAPHKSSPGATPSGETAPATEESTGSEPSGKKETGEEKSKAKYPEITRVWLVELSGMSFSEALSSPSKASYIDSQAIPQGSLLSGWSAIAASSFATDVAQITTKKPSIVQTVVQPPCPAGQECLPGTPGGLAAADAFLEKTLPKLSASTSYSTGLVAITFGIVAAGAESELPAGSTTSLLASQPAAGALLISPYVAAGKRPNTKFDPASPSGSMEALLSR